MFPRNKLWFVIYWPIYDKTYAAVQSAADLSWSSPLPDIFGECRLGAREITFDGYAESPALRPRDDINETSEKYVEINRNRA